MLIYVALQSYSLAERNMLSPNLRLYELSASVFLYLRFDSLESFTAALHFLLLVIFQFFLFFFLKLFSHLRYFISTCVSMIDPFLFFCLFGFSCIEEDPGSFFFFSFANFSLNSDDINNWFFFFLYPIFFS